VKSVSNSSQADSLLEVNVVLSRHFGHCIYLCLQGQKLINEAVNDVVQGMDLGDNEPSESDTDSLSTPTNSPSHRPMTGNM
jgi:hypothetical protein